MGCDIHIAIQCKEDGLWKEVIWQNPPYDFDGAPKAVKGIPVAPENFTNRNYNLFGILADVRNGVGFAGIRTGESWPSIAAGRGWPEDITTTEFAPNPQWPEEGPRNLGDHSFTWVSLKELEDFSWDTVSRTLYGIVGASEFEALNGAIPTSYCGGVSGPDVRVYDPASYRLAKESGTLVPNPYVQISWEYSARQATYDWPGKVIPWLEQLAGGHELRLILGFDS